MDDRIKAMLHEATFHATCNATMTNKKPFKLQRGCYTQATCLATLRKVESRSTFLATRNATILVTKWGVTREFFLAAWFVALQVARKIASCKAIPDPARRPPDFSTVPADREPGTGNEQPLTRHTGDTAQGGMGTE